MSGYCGETYAKKVARFFAYWQALRHPFVSRRVVRHEGVAITLCGPEAAEVGLFRRYLKRAPQRSIFADLDSGSLSSATARWPGVRTHAGDVRELLRSCGGVGFAHLDFLGRLNGVAKEAIALAARRLLPGGVLMYTYFRGRETSAERSLIGAQFTNSWARRFGLDSGDVAEAMETRNGMQIARHGWYLTQVRAIAAEASPGCYFYPVLTGLRYQSSSPMAILAITKSLTAKSPHVALHRSKVSFRVPGEDQAKLLIAEMLSEAGASKAGMCEMLNIEASSAAAIIAHATRGSYGVTSLEAVDPV